MSDILVETVANKLTSVSYESLEKAMRLTKSSGHRHLEIVHWLYYLVRDDNTDLVHILRHFDIDLGEVDADLQATIAKFKINQTELPGMAAPFQEALERAWFEGTLRYGDYKIRSAYVLMAAMSDKGTWRQFLSYSDKFSEINRDLLVKNLDAIAGASGETRARPVDGSGPKASPAGSADPSEAGPGSGAGEDALTQFTVDFTARARAEEFDPIVGRDDEIRQVIDVLMRRRQNNPILTGEAGVGKTAIVEGFAQKIVAGDVPPALLGTRLCALDLGLLQAGASMKGEFEKRLRAVIDAVHASIVPTILFIDEAHTLIGAGGAAGTGDAANLLKPALARGTLRTVAATTWSEYRQHFEKDPALTRRFQPVQVDEPDEEKCFAMVRGLLGPMEDHHQVRILDSAVRSAVSLSHRYIPARQLPDKAVSVLDTASARVNISQAAQPARLSDLVARKGFLETELKAITNDTELGLDHEEQINSVTAAIGQTEQDIETLRAEWERERKLVAEIRRLNKALTDLKGGEPAPHPEPAEIEDPEHDGPALVPIDDIELDLDVDFSSEDAIRTALHDKRAALSEIPEDDRMVYAYVDDEAVASIISDWTGIPVGRMVQDEMQTILSLTDSLNKRVIGQSHGLSMIAKRIETSRAQLGNPNKPIGVFMLCGPSGVGKTETALALAETLYGGEDSLITINMSEFQEAHSVSGLKGAPPGYVGYGEGGRLTEAVRRKPYSVVLLDEVEKAHPDVHEIFFQVFDKGWMEDGMGRKIDFRNTLILLTSNVGTDLIMQAAAHMLDAPVSSDPALAATDPNAPDPEKLAEDLRPALLDVFPPALLGRIVTIPYYPLSPSMLGFIVKLQLNKIVKRVKQNRNAELTYGDDLVSHIVSLCRDPDSGGRMIDNILTNDLLPKLSRSFLTAQMNGEELNAVTLTAAENGIEISA
ncbi:type VI secretion system ATPase TssH [Roseibium denhamense]|uniref:Type VI secretion system protein VasG n=1 Tax=Roseibium denhamense TaxID=76305 RepID=A0ABY1NQQ3_9HYPH|nr:type VI secretion system ATPase TssH [Roseibium denhamense]MTI08040.1 type VI secretion system ATPase TssH [Roseibium denhamense]SMP15821.1 type VI secretion system protein VasG [Roseibium denhamense]